MSAPGQRIRIVLVDDHPVVRQGLRKILSTFNEIEIVGEACSGREAIHVAHEIKPDVMLMDISMPDMNGIEATTILRRDLPEVKVLALSMHENASYVKQALKAGARGYLLKESAPKDLVEAISSVHSASEAVMPAEVLARTEDRSNELTPREVEVLRRIARGLSNKEIGTELSVGVRTVETHRQNLINKTGMKTVAELTRYAVDNGYVELNTAQ
jgi:DNA-binding NarL/FixJ family response regulator